MLILSTVAAASAADPSWDTLFAAQELPAVAVSCQPLAGALALLAKSPLEDAGVLDAEPWPTLLREDGPASLGLDAQGAVQFGLWMHEEGRAGSLVLGVTDPSLATLELDRRSTRVALGWEVRPQGALEPIRLTLEGTTLRASQGAPVAAGPSQVPRILDTPPSAGACVAWVGGVPGLPTAQDIVLEVPFEGNAPLSLKTPVQSGGAWPAPATSVAWRGSSHEAPTVVIALSAPLFELLDSGVLEEAIRLPKDEVARLRGRVEVPPGAVLALAGFPRTEGWAAAVPLHRAGGRPIPARPAMKRILADLDGDVTHVERVSATRAVIHQEGAPELHLATDHGWVVLGSRAAWVDESASGAGAPWVDGTFEAGALNATVAARFDVPMDTSRIVAVATLDVRDGIARVALSGAGGDTPTAASLLDLALSTGSASLRVRAAAGEVQSVLHQLEELQLETFTRTGRFQALDPEPRAPELLDEAPASWVVSPPWSALGFEAPRATAFGSYWVEVASDGRSFVAHGQVDADGDGVPAHWTATGDGPTLVTPPDVF